MEKIKLGSNLDYYNEENCIYPIICFKNWKLKIATLTPNGIIWDKMIPNNQELKKGIEEKWFCKRTELYMKQKCICPYCKKEIISPTLHHTKTEDLCKKINKKFQDIDKQVLKGKINVLSAYHKRNNLIEEYEEYYGSLKDTETWCKECHSKFHKFI